MEQLSVGIIARSRKESERRLAIHPRHLERIEPELRARVLLETGYGEPFGVPDEQLRPLVAGVRPRERLFAEADVILLPKPLPQDLAEMREGQVLWGWPHCVQDVEITQLAIDRRLTVIAFEAMNHWTADGAFSLHVLPQEQRAGGLRLGPPRAGARRVDGRLRPEAARGRHRVRGDGAGCRDGPEALGVTDVDVLTHRAWRRSRRRSTRPGSCSSGRTRTTRAATRSRPRPGRNPWPATSPLTTSSSTACSRTRTTR